MKNYYKQNFFKFLSIFLIFLTVIFFFYGFLVGENSAGAGGFKGDFDNFWITLQTFLNNDILTSIKISGEVVMPGQERLYISSRTPLIFIFNKLFNPFVESKINFIRSIFFFFTLSTNIILLFIENKISKD